MNQINIQYFKTPYGELILGSYDDKLCMADWLNRAGRNSIDKRLQNAFKVDFIEEDTGILGETRKQLGEYFNSQRKSFDIPLLMVGTEFQKHIWKVLMQIPFGSTISYREVAQQINNEKAVRAVANAIGANALSILLPCHRVIGSNGKLTGYAGGLSAKKQLLELEQYIKSSSRLK